MSAQGPRESRLLPGQDWKTVHLVKVSDRMQITTEVLELPHGALVRSTVVTRSWTGFSVAVSTVFVPSMRLEPHGENYKLAFKPL